MLKKAVIFGLFCGAIGVPCQPNNAAYHNGSNRTQGDPASPSLPTPVPVAVKPEPQQDKSRASGNSPAGNQSIERPAIVWYRDSSWWLVGIAGLTGLVIAWQSSETRKAAGAGRAAAQAALKQADHISATERAWIKVTPHVASFTFRPEREKNAPVPENLVEVIGIAHQFPARIENVGQTPAKLVGSAIRYIRSRTHPSDYPQIPDYGTLTEFEMYVFTEMKDVALTGRLEPTGTLTTAQIQAIEDREEFLFAYGIIKYLDVYGKPHETRFGYAYEPQVRHFIQVDGVIHTVKTGEGNFRIGGPPKYNGHT